MTLTNSKEYICAYLLSAYTEPKSLVHLVNALDNEQVEFYIHIDKKVDISAFKVPLQNRKNVYFLPEKKRVFVYWGGTRKLRCNTI